MLESAFDAARGRRLPLLLLPLAVGVRRRALAVGSSSSSAGILGAGTPSAGQSACQ